MNKIEIESIFAVAPLSTQVSKSLVNRLDSALSKEGTPAQLLASATSSVKALSESVSDDDADDFLYTQLVAGIFEIALEVVKRGKEKPAQPAKARKSGWENLRDADEIEAPAKPAKRAKVEPKKLAISPELIEALSQLLARG